MNKKVLIITYYWPPAGGPGVQRVLKFAKYLPEFGWDPIILTIEDGDYHAVDDSLCKEIPKNLKVYKTKVFSVLDLYKKLKGKNEAISSFELTKKDGGFKFKLVKWIRANFFIPDARGAWNRSAIKLGLKIIREEKPDLIFTSSPPHSLQLIGLKLKQKTGLKWIADFRDPWTDAFWDKELPRMRVLSKYNSWLENKVITSADNCTAVSVGSAQLLKKDLTTDFNILPNGYDSEDFNKTEYNKSQKFRITYIGSIAESQNPSNLFKCLSNLPEEVESLLEINFYGVFDSSVKNTAGNSGAAIQFHSYIPHSLAIHKMVNSEILLLLIPQNSKGILTGKIYEYIATKNFILGIAPKDSEIKETLIRCNCGKTITFDDDPTEILLQQVNNWKNNQPLKVNSGEIEKLSRKNITQKLAEIFKYEISA